MARDWVIGLAKSCGNFSCEDYKRAPKGSAFSLDEKTGVALFVCDTCRRTHESHLRAFREGRACEACGWVRRVKVQLAAWADNGEYFARYCDACRAMASAQAHRKTADRLEEKARDIYAARTKTRRSA